MADMRERFNAKIVNIMNNKKANSGFLTKETYDNLLKKVNDSKNKRSKKNLKIIKD